jgi:hypothetical protein
MSTEEKKINVQRVPFITKPRARNKGVQNDAQYAVNKRHYALHADKYRIPLKENRTYKKRIKNEYIKRINAFIVANLGVLNVDHLSEPDTFRKICDALIPSLSV